MTNCALVTLPVKFILPDSSPTMIPSALTVSTAPVWVEDAAEAPTVRRPHSMQAAKSREIALLFIVFPPFQSKCSASMGLRRAAFFAGRYPNRTPMPAEMPNAIMTAANPGSTVKLSPISAVMTWLATADIK